MKLDKALQAIDSKTVELVKGGKKAVIGEIRQFAGRDYIKTNDGWKFHGKGTGKKAQEHKAGATSGEKKLSKQEKDFEAHKERERNAVKIDHKGKGVMYMHQDSREITEGANKGLIAVTVTRYDSEQDRKDAVDGKVVIRHTYPEFFTKEEYQKIKESSSKIGNSDNTKKDIEVGNLSARILKNEKSNSLTENEVTGLRKKLSEGDSEYVKNYLDKREKSEKVKEAAKTVDAVKDKVESHYKELQKNVELASQKATEATIAHRKSKSPFSKRALDSANRAYDTAVSKVDSFRYNHSGIVSILKKNNISASTTSSTAIRGYRVNSSGYEIDRKLNPNYINFHSIKKERVEQIAKELNSAGFKTMISGNSIKIEPFYKFKGE